ncbi:hypothetical protein C8R41DRAFT_916183 [Lentinula lateritia]|uniref:Yeast cell wall synthesis Kre9/Knh1-like N-terminal domain-containing protein n=1 Tax=Lentinula lateritia TaxID=40482 RepID=A0ABQ8VQW1_9AGAR|nr:hypothetical protein C8R41DRAFT_916183 [Lentinula lateritia]
MFYLASLVVLLPVFQVRSVVGDGITPIAPGPGDQFNAGSPCTIQWQVGENWSNFTISLMSGSNTQMQLVAPVASGLDGSNAAFSPFNWTCPEVNPYSAIYFYQFTNSNDTTNSKWTTRFTIASPSGESSPPSNSTQPNGDSIPWGVGSLNSASANSSDSQESNPSLSATVTSAPSSTIIASNSSSKLRKSRMSATSTERQATPTIDIPSGTLTTDAAATATTFAAYRPNVQNGNSAQGWNQAFSAWTVVFVLVLMGLNNLP